MNVSDLDDLFEIAEYQPYIDGRATIELDDSSVRIRLPYRFRSSIGTTSPTVMVIAEATAQQLTNARAFLVAIVQATNAAIETQHGWTKYIEPVEP